MKRQLTGNGPLVRMRNKYSLRHFAKIEIELVTAGQNQRILVPQLRNNRSI